MKKINIIFWISTGLLALLMGVGSISNVLKQPEAVALFQHLGYPVYLLPFLGVAKILGVITILVPGFPRLKEWAYAGLTFDLAGAMYSGICVDGAGPAVLVFLVGFGLIALSYIYHHKKQKAALLKVMA
ncbi:DoxX-like family protein [Chitinophaga rupis]|uniref:DoxX-like family protein n=1 Tax=Chitinophaga rupis TaxID=573321 RepID=A0A1H7T0A6_9BACT|nr:DoxX family protein [Chitinophaga rupis]SEL78291.1 DoxX-like family protein [Chitinophaga rupis]